MKTIFLRFIIIGISIFSFFNCRVCAQQVEYVNLGFEYSFPPSYKINSGEKTYDIHVVEMRKAPVAEYNIPIEGFIQVPSNGVLHIIPVVETFNFRSGARKIDPGYSVMVNISIITKIFDGNGNLLHEHKFAKEDYVAKVLVAAATDHEEEFNNEVRKKIIELVVQKSIVPFVEGLAGVKYKDRFALAYLKDIKKFPELGTLKTQVYEVMHVLRNRGQDAFVHFSEKYVNDWIKLSKWDGPGDKFEIRRAADQDLAMYYMMKGEKDLAYEVLEEYESYDKEIKELFGLERYTNSHEIARILEQLLPEVKEISNAQGQSITMDQLTEKSVYFVINGTIKVESKKVSGEFKGKIKLFLPGMREGEYAGKNTFDFSADELKLYVEATNSEGQVVQFNCLGSAVKTLIDTSGGVYVFKTFGAAYLKNAAYLLLIQTYTSPKINTYRSIIPTANEYYIEKAGDDNGIRSTNLTFKKSLSNYLNDCPKIAENFKNGTYKSRAKVEQIAEDYSKCNE